MDEESLRRSREAAERAWRLQRAGSFTDRCPSRSEMAAIAERLWDLSYRHTDDDVQALQLMAEGLSATSPLEARSLEIPYEQIFKMGLARWADQAYPEVRMGHTYAAALMATSVGQDLSDLVLPPWKAFLIAVPDGLLRVTDSRAGGEAEVRHVLVHCFELEGTRWNWVAVTDTACMLWSHGGGTDTLVDSQLADGRWEGCSFMSEVKDQDERASRLIGRLIVNVCLAMQDGDSVRAPKGGRSGARRRRSDGPKVRVFQLGRPLKTDCRPAVSDYLYGRGPSPKVQTLVSGHRRRKPGGAARGEPKTLWIEPYWRGPEDAPILVRPKVVG